MRSFSLEMILSCIMADAHLNAHCNAVSPLASCRFMPSVQSMAKSTESLLSHLDCAGV